MWIKSKSKIRDLCRDKNADWQYSQAVRAGNMVYTSGSVGMTKEGQMVEGTVQDRTRQVIKVGLVKGSALEMSWRCGDAETWKYGDEDRLVSITLASNDRRHAEHSRIAHAKRMH